MIAAGPLRDMGGPEVWLMALILAIGISALAAFSAAAVAVAVVGPRRMDAVPLPAAAAFIAWVTSFLLIRNIPPLGVLAIGFGVALFVAWLQKENIADPARPSATGVFIGGRALVGLLAGLSLGVVGAVVMANAIMLAILTLGGLALGLRWGMGAQSSSEPADITPPPEPEAPPGMLDG